MATVLPNPLRPGYRPDPSIVRVGNDYYLVNSTFEYLPGIPVQHSHDLVTWTTIGHVISRPEQLDLASAPTLGGVWAPTIRHHDGVFYVIVTVAMGAGTLVFRAEDPAGPWSDPVAIDVDGIDPDLAWEGEDCYVTYSAFRIAKGEHGGIEQVRVDLTTGEVLEQPRTLWSGTGLMFPEGPHLYRISEWWYLVIAEGGTERGHSVSVARSLNPYGPFTGCPGNPVLSASGTDRPVQNSGHGDLVEGPDGWLLVLLGMRTFGLNRAFSPLGRETFVTEVTWNPHGWPAVAPVILTGPPADVSWAEDFSTDLGPDWFAIRDLPAAVGRTGAPGLVVHGREKDLSDAHVAFLGVRQDRLYVRFAAHVSTTGTGGVTLRYDDLHHLDVELRGDEVAARASVSTISQEWCAPRPAGEVELWVRTRPVDPDRGLLAGIACDEVQLGYTCGGTEVTLATVDGRYYSAEPTASFTGRVLGLYATSGDLAVSRVTYEGSDVA